MFDSANSKYRSWRDKEAQGKSGGVTLEMDNVKIPTSPQYTHANRTGRGLAEFPSI